MRYFRTSLTAFFAGMLLVTTNLWADEQSYELNIAKQKLSSALIQFAEQSGLQVVYFATMAEGETTDGISGNYSAEDALSALLSNTDLVANNLDEQTYSITHEPNAHGGQSLPGKAVPASSTILVAQAQTSVPQNQAPSGNAGNRGNNEASRPRIEEMLVTGSRIVGASDSGTIAVTILSAEELDTLGETSTGEILQNLAQVGSFEINDSSDGPNDARGDVATVNLRGLGTGNTLILLNGRRITAHGINQDVGSVPRQITNVNAFPAAAINRIEVLRDGASALYGADATAGVVNTILTPDFDKTRLRLRFDDLEGNDSDTVMFDFATGFQFNEGRTKVLVVGSYFTRDGLFATELDGQFNNVDKRGFLGNSPFAASSDFRNTSSNSPFGSFEVISSFERELGTFEDENVDLDDDFAASIGLTDADLTSGGRFHVEPCGFSNRSRVQIGVSVDGCMAIGENSIPSDLRFDFNGFQPKNSLGDGFEIVLDNKSARGRQLISDADRYNFYSLVEHDFNDTLQGFGEVLYYRSETEAQRAPSPLSRSAGIVVPKSNFYNPFGPIGSANRIQGLEAGDVPDEGYDLLIRNLRPLEGGPRIIETESYTYRVLGGLRGNFDNWDWESAIGYSANRTQDEENRLSKTRLTAALARSTPDAFNPFGSNANSRALLDEISVIVKGVGETSLLTADFRASRPDLLSTWAGSVGAAFGFDYRREDYDENRDPHIDGTIQFDGVGSGVSDIVSISPTSDSSANRSVYAGYLEFLVPIVEQQDGFFSNELNLQLAARAEYFDDIDEFEVTPKIAASYFPFRGLSFRATYSEGFRAPNLVQLNRGDTSRLANGFEDFIRENAIGDPEDTGDANLRSLRISNPDLKPEDTETYVFGLTLNAAEWLNIEWLSLLQLDVDFWHFEQTGVIDDFGVQEALALDFVRRANGTSNPNVHRAPVTPEDQLLFDAFNAANPNDQVPVAGQVLFVDNPFINLDLQEAEGYDFGLQIHIDSELLGRFRARVEYSILDELDVFRNAELTALTSDPRFSSEFDAISIDRIKVNGNPRIRSLSSLTWRKGPVGAGLSVRYVSGFRDTSVDNIDLDGDGEIDFFPVDSQKRVNVYLDYRFALGFSSEADSRLRFGVNNVTDESPPLADESRGFFTSVHSVRGRQYYLQLRTEF